MIQFRARQIGELEKNVLVTLQKNRRGHTISVEDVRSMGMHQSADLTLDDLRSLKFFIDQELSNQTPDEVLE